VKAILNCALACAVVFIVSGCGGGSSSSEETVPVTGVTLNKTSISTYPSGTEQLMATIAPPNATNQKVTWSVYPSGYDSVSSNGLVTAGAMDGTSNIMVKTSDGNFTATCELIVTGSAP